MYFCNYYRGYYFLKYDKRFPGLPDLIKRENLTFGSFNFHINVFHGKDGCVVCVKYIGVIYRHFYIYYKAFGVTHKVIEDLTFFHFSLLLLFLLELNTTSCVNIITAYYDIS